MKLDGREIKPYNIVQTPLEAFNTVGNEPKVLVTDFDDTLVFTEVKHLKLMLESEYVDEFKKYLNLKPYSKRFLYDRTKYMITDWLRKSKDIEIPKDIETKVTNLFCTPDFYKDVEPTKFAYTVRNYIDQPICEKVYVVSHCVGENMEQAINGKIDWLSEFFKDSVHPEKVEFIPTTDTRKSVPIMERNIKWDIFADDRLDCIRDMVLFAEGFGNEIIIPRCGYNDKSLEFSSLVQKFNLQTFYIDNL